MPVSERKRISNDKYNSKCDQFVITPSKPVGNAIRRAAHTSGLSLQGYILQALSEQMEREGRKLYD